MIRDLTIFSRKKKTIPSSGESRYSVPSNLIKVNQMGQSSKSTCTKCEWIPQHGNLKANWLLPRFMLPKCGGHVGVAQGPKGSEISKTSPTPVELQILKKKTPEIYIFFHPWLYIYHVLVFNSINFSIIGLCFSHVFTANHPIFQGLTMTGFATVMLHRVPQHHRDWWNHWTIGPSMIAPDKSPFWVMFHLLKMKTYTVVKNDTHHIKNLKQWTDCLAIGYVDLIFNLS